MTEIARSLANGHGNVGRLQFVTGQPERALESYGKAHTIFERLARENPAVTQFATDLANSYNDIGQMQLNMGQPERALDSGIKALTILERLVREDPNDTDLASRLGGMLNNISRIDLLHQRYGEAKHRLLNAIVLQEKALAANPHDPSYRRALQGHYSNLLTAARGLGDDALAQEAQRGLDELDATDPRIQALDARLAAVMKEETAKDNAERLALAQRAYDKALYTTAARLWGEALAGRPQARRRPPGLRIATTPPAPPRWPVAARARTIPRPMTPPKAKLRQQALDWLKAELAVWSKIAESGPPQAKAVHRPDLEALARGRRPRRHPRREGTGRARRGRSQAVARPVGRGRRLARGSRSGMTAIRLSGTSSKVRRGRGLPVRSRSHERRDPVPRRPREIEPARTRRVPGRGLRRQSPASRSRGGPPGIA